MNTKRIVWVLGTVVATIYILPKALDKVADGFDKLAIKTEQLALEFRLAGVCTRIVAEHPELQDDPRLLALGEDLSFLEIKQRFNDK